MQNTLWNSLMWRILHRIKKHSEKNLADSADLRPAKTCRLEETSAVHLVQCPLKERKYSKWDHVPQGFCQGRDFTHILDNLLLCLTTLHEMFSYNVQITLPECVAPPLVLSFCTQGGSFRMPTNFLFKQVKTQSEAENAWLFCFAK